MLHIYISQDYVLHITRLWTCFLLLFTHVWASSQLRSSQCLLWTCHKQWPPPPFQMLQILEFFLRMQGRKTVSENWYSVNGSVSLFPYKVVYNLWISLETGPKQVFSWNINLFLNQVGVAFGEAWYARSCWILFVDGYGYSFMGKIWYYVTRR